MAMTWTDELLHVAEVLNDLHRECKRTNHPTSIDCDCCYALQGFAESITDNAEYVARKPVIAGPVCENS